MNILEKIAKDDPQKIKELAAFHWFTKAAEINYGGLELCESPDFLIEINGKQIGVEITEAHRQVDGSPYPVVEMETAQRKFAEVLLDTVDPVLPVDIGLIFEDGVAAKKDVLQSIRPIADSIREVTETMQPHSAKLLVRNEGDMNRSCHEKYVCPEIPNFLQHIQIFNDGHETTLITGSRGCFLEPLGKSELEEVLKKKHKALKGYKPCDEYWLVIVTRNVPNIVLPSERPRILLSSSATEFSGIDFDTPVKSEFDRVYYFEAPADVTLLTQ